MVRSPERLVTKNIPYPPPSTTKPSSTPVPGGLACFSSLPLTYLHDIYRSSKWTEETWQVPKPRACCLHHSTPIPTTWPSMKSKAGHDKGLGHSISSLCCPSELEAMRPGWTSLIYSITVPALWCRHKKIRGASSKCLDK